MSLCGTDAAFRRRDAIPRRSFRWSTELLRILNDHQVPCFCLALVGAVFLLNILSNANFESVWWKLCCSVDVGICLLLGNTRLTNCEAQPHSCHVKWEAILLHIGRIRKHECCGVVGPENQPRCSDNGPIMKRIFTQTEGQLCLTSKLSRQAEFKRLQILCQLPFSLLTANKILFRIFLPSIRLMKKLISWSQKFSAIRSCQGKSAPVRDLHVCWLPSTASPCLDARRKLCDSPRTCTSLHCVFWKMNEYSSYSNVHLPDVLTS